MIVLNCKECGSPLLTPEKERKYKEGKVVTNEGCVINPKIINGKEHRRVRCYDCFEKKFGRKPKRFNMVGYDMCYLMDATEEDIKEHRKIVNNVTEEGMIRRYGEEEGLKKWNKYRETQAKTNSLEYKKEKYGWTEEQFDEYNKTRAVTLENCIKRHGKKKGTKVFNDYCDRQSYAGCKEEYFIEKYGEKEGKDRYLQINEKKIVSLNSLVKKYGLEKGQKRWSQHISNRNFSKIAMEMFNGISHSMNKKYYYIREDSCEYVCYLEKLDSYAQIDFYDEENNKAIEFFGDYWHCNPNKYNDDYYHKHKEKTAKEIREYDKQRIDAIEKEHGIKTLTVWESEYNNNKEETIKKCLRFLEQE